MSDTDKKSEKTGGKGKRILLFTAAAVVLGGGGLGAGLYANGTFPGMSEGGPVVDPARPHLVARKGVSQAAVARYSSPNGDGPINPKLFQASYYPIKDPFTVNLKDTDAFIQVGVAVSSYYDERVFENVKLHELAIRSAVLMTLANQDALQVSTSEGKKQLRKDLRVAINDVLKAKEGFGGIEDVHFTNMIIQ